MSAPAPLGTRLSLGSDLDVTVSGVRYAGGVGAADDPLWTALPSPLRGAVSDWRLRISGRLSCRANGIFAPLGDGEPDWVAGSPSPLMWSIACRAWGSTFTAPEDGSNETFTGAPSRNDVTSVRHFCGAPPTPVAAPLPARLLLGLLERGHRVHAGAILVDSFEPLLCTCWRRSWALGCHGRLLAGELDALEYFEVDVAPLRGPLCDHLG